MKKIEVDAVPVIAIQFEGKEIDMLLHISRMNCSIPELAGSNHREAVKSLLDQMRYILDPKNF